MSNELDWYEVAHDTSLRQGDILLSCPAFTIDGIHHWPLPPDANVEVQAKVFDLVVMTQSCDLQNDKIEDVLLAQVATWSDVVQLESERGNEAVCSRKFRKSLVDGNIPGLSLLRKRGQAPSIPWSVVDFHRLVTLPKAFVDQFARDADPRLRIRSPYREHLAQAFARYFMRVGLPHDAREFEQEGATQ